MDKPLVSVVLPIYNVEKYLDRCIRSVVEQTYDNLEIILVDDGSPDGCPGMCDDWAARDSRIRVVHKKNAGLGFARNTGIEHATGEYICFFDSDDYIEPNTIELCVTNAVKESADIVCFGNDILAQDGTVLNRRIPTPPKYIYSGDEIRNVMMPNALSYHSGTGEDWHLLMSAWSSLYSMDLIRKSGWKFVSEREIISEDFYSILELYQYIRKAVILPEVLYHYIANPVSLSRSYRADRYDKLVYFVEKLTELSAKMNSQDILQERIDRVFLGLCIGVMKQIVAVSLPLKQKKNELCRVLSGKQMRRVFQENDFSGESILRQFLFWAMKRGYVMICYVIIAVRNMMDK